MIRCAWKIAFGVLAFTAFYVPIAHSDDRGMAAQVAQANVADISSIEGIRDNQLVGYGIVVGLHGTGDSQETIFPYQTLISTLERMGVNLPRGQGAQGMQERNMAAVFIAATLPPFAEPGNRIDVIVSSAGDARSIQGGLLLMTPLYGPDGQIYAQAQGPVVIGGYTVGANGSSKTMNDPTTGRLPNGAIVERAVPLNLANMRHISLLLNNPDFRTAEDVASSINGMLNRQAAHAVNSRNIEITPLAGEDIPSLLARVEALTVPVFPPARVVVNERTGTIVIGGNVKLQPVSILQGGLVVNVLTQAEVSQPNAFGQGTTQVVRQSTIQAQAKTANHIDLKAGATVEDLVQGLQQIGATAFDIISILQAMKQAGALDADLVTM